RLGWDFGGQESLRNLPHPRTRAHFGKRGPAGSHAQANAGKARPPIAPGLRPTRPSIPPPHSRTPRLRPRSLHAPPRGLAVLTAAIAQRFVDVGVSQEIEQAEEALH